MNKNIKILISVLAVTLVIVFLLTLKFPIGQSFQIVYGLIFVLFLPGFIWSYVFFKGFRLEIIERITLSFVLSITLGPLIIFLLNKVGMKITVLTSFLVTLGIIILGIMILFIQKSKTGKR